MVQPLAKKFDSRPHGAPGPTTNYRTQAGQPSQIRKGIHLVEEARTAAAGRMAHRRQQVAASKIVLDSIRRERARSVAPWRAPN